MNVGQDGSVKPRRDRPAALLRHADLGFLAGLRAYLALTKPRIILLLLVTTVPAMVLAEGGMPSLGLVVLTLLGGSLAAGGANAINCYLDRDIDGMMARTRGRPLPAGLIEPRPALIFGILLGAAGFGVLLAGVNVASALLVVGALAIYVFVYTLWLKRTTTQNIVVGGAAGAIPPVVGWAAVTGGLDWPALVLFAIILLWTPPHFWALALRHRVEYARAEVPMLPVAGGESETRRQILLYSLGLVSATLLLAPSAAMGYLYLGAAVALGACFLCLAVRVWLTETEEAARALFLYSIPYLGLLFVAMALDELGHW